MARKDASLVKKIPSAASASEDVDDVLMQQFTRDLKLLLRQVGNAKRSPAQSTDSDDKKKRQTPGPDIQDAAEEVAYYGSFAQRFIVLVHKVQLATQDQQLALDKQQRLLLDFGNKFYAQQEFRAASRFFYKNVVESVLEQHGQENQGSSVSSPPTKSIKPQPNGTQNDDEAKVLYVRALYGQAMCLFRVQKRRDEVVRHPGTLEKMLEALRLLQRGMEEATKLDHKSSKSPHRYSWLVLNGSILIFSITKPLSTLGFAKEVVGFLKWVILAIESVVTLSTTKYILWRLQLLALTCECYKLMAFQTQDSSPKATAMYLKAALNCAEYAQQAVLRLKKEEELDLPLPKDVVHTLTQAQTTASMLVACAKAIASQETLSRRQIETVFSSTSVGERVRVAMDMVESLTQSDRRCVGVLSSPSTPHIAEQIGELLDFITGMVTPLLPSQASLDKQVADPALPLRDELQQVFPLSFHLTVLRHCYRVGKTEQLVSLLKAVEMRLPLSSEALSKADCERCTQELELFKALARLKTQEQTARGKEEQPDLSKQRHPHLKLLKSETTLPPAKALLRLTKALTSCLYQGTGSMSHTNSDLMLAVALKLWQQYALPMVNEIDATDPSELPRQTVKVASEILLASHLAFSFADLDDLLLHGQVCIRLTSLLQLQKKWRLAIQVLRSLLERINRKRDELARFESHFEAITSTGLESSSLALSCSTISFSTVDHDLSCSDAATNLNRESGGVATTNARDRVGVFGTGSQFGSFHHDLCCLQVDLVLLLYQVELEEASAVDALPSSSATVSPSSPFESLLLVKAMEDKVLLECRKNSYNKVLLSIQRMRHHHSTNASFRSAENATIAVQAMKLLERLESQERELLSRLKKTATMSANDLHHHKAFDLNVPLPPVVIARSSTAVTVRILNFVPSQPSLRKRKIAYYMVFAKPSGAGTAVSLNNNELPGTAEPVYSTASQQQRLISTTIGGLLPNESYVFAVAAFDHNDDVIQGIGQTSEPVVALHPLPISLCYGYLAQACYKFLDDGAGSVSDPLKSASRAAALALYNSVVSRDASSRALWKANSFYRHALKRNVIAKLPIPILNLVVQAILILTHDEIGDQERDGMLYDHPEHRSLLSKQVEALEASRKIAIGVELASAAVNTEATRELCFKGYRMLLPLLHLDQCNGLTFAPLMTLYQALLTIRRVEWGVDTKSIFARISFELFRIAMTSGHLSPVIYPSLVNETLQFHHQQQQQQQESNEYQSLCEVIVTQEALTARTGSTAAPVAQPAAAAASLAKNPPSGAAKGATPAANASASTPQSTPRQPADEAEAEPKLPPLKDILQQANFNLLDALKLLETESTSVARSDVQYTEYVCKIAYIALQKGDDGIAETCLAATKLKGSMSDQFREVMTTLGGEHLLPEVVVAAGAGTGAGGDDPSEALASARSAPTTARSVKTPRQTQQKPAKDEASTPSPTTSELVIDTPALPKPSATHDNAATAASGEDDDFLYLWAGEVLFLQALLLFRKLVSMQSTAVDVNSGPAFDSTFEMLHFSGNSKRSSSVVVPSEWRDAAGGQLSYHDQDQTSSEPVIRSDHDELVDVFAQFLAKMSAACELFRCGKAWQALQASCQYVWNAIWIVWLSPDRFSASLSPSSPPSPPAWLDQLSLCVDALLGMVEAVIYAVNEQNAQALTKTPNSSAAGPQTVLAMNRSLLQTSMASTVVVSSAMNAMSADVTWVVHFVTFAVKALYAQEKWETIVRIGKKFHFLLGNDDTGSRFSERNFPAMIYAQRQLLEAATAILEAAEQDLVTFIREFTESEAKKKKKKSRLVVEEVLTPEELEFRAKRDAMEDNIRLLTEQRNHQREEMQQLTTIHESLTKSTNKCVQALDAIHELVEQYRRTEATNTQSLALKNQILSAYNHCILLSRQKRQQRLLCQVYQEVGDFHLAYSGTGAGREHGGDVKLAVKNWHECLDNAFGTLNVVQSWREVLARSTREQLPNGVSGADQIQGDGFWIALISCSTLTKLVMHATTSNCFQAVEYSLMAAKIFSQLFASSMPHPTREFLYGSYELGNEFWPGRDLMNAEQVSPFSLALFFILVPEVLLQYECYAENAMPVIAGYEFVARYCLESKSHVANARRLRVEALAQCGRVSEALDVLSLLFDGVEAASTREKLNPTCTLAGVSYHDNKPLKDEANAAALVWFTTIDIHKIYADLARTLQSEPLVLEILVVILQLVVRLSRHESNLVDGCSPLRPAAEKIAQGLLQLTEQSQSAESLDTEHPQTSWCSAHSSSLRGEVLLQQSYLAYSEGQWSLARELSVKALEVQMLSKIGGSANASSFGVVSLDLEQELKFGLFRRPSTFVAKCRLQNMRCDLAQGHFHAVLSQSEVTLHECRENGEDHLSEQAEVLRSQALVFVGKRDEAENNLEKLRVTAILRFTDCSLTFVQSLLMASTVLRAKVLLTAKSELLLAAKDRLMEAEHVLDDLLERGGWIGVGDLVDPHTEKRLNLYNPAIVSFVLVKAGLAQTLVESAIDFGSETSAQRQEKILKLIESGLRATLHTTRRVGSAKALLLLLKGSILKKILINHHSQPQYQQHLKRAIMQKQTRLDLPQERDGEQAQLDGIQVAHMFAESATSLTECIETSIHSGGYDRRLVRMALIELVDLYGQKLIHAKEDEHIQAAFHYLSFAVQVQNHEFILFETLELQTGTVTSLDKLPPFILNAISDGSAAPPPSLANKLDPPTPATAKKAGPAATGIAGADAVHPSPPDATRLVNYYLRLQREQHVLPVCGEIQQETVHWLHTFLLQNHSSYAKSCCLSALPKVPTTDPEIKASLVCAQWGKDITPAVLTHASLDESGAGENQPSSSTAAAGSSRLTLYFTLGTTRIDILCNEDLTVAATSRMEDFLRAPLLSKKPGLEEQQVNAIRSQLSRLRVRIEDEESLVIDRSMFESELLTILHAIQLFFRPSGSAAINPELAHELGSLAGVSQAEDKSASPRDSSTLIDVFGNPIHLPCTLEMVRNLENLFTVQKGVYTSDNVLCYFLRDLLEHEE